MIVNEYKKVNPWSEDVNIVEKHDAKVSWIYEQYHEGKVLTIDDFKYLCTKDPEGCKCLMHSIIEDKREKKQTSRRTQSEQAAIEYINKLEKELALARARLSHQGRKVMPAVGQQTLVSVKESLENVKEMILVMDQPELNDMMNHLYEASELRKQYEDEYMGWEMLLEETDRYYTPYEESQTVYHV